MAAHSMGRFVHIYVGWLLGYLINICWLLGYVCSVCSSMEVFRSVIEASGEVRHIMTGHCHYLNSIVAAHTLLALTVTYRNRRKSAQNAVLDKLYYQVISKYPI